MDALMVKVVVAVLLVAGCSGEHRAPADAETVALVGCEVDGHHFGVGEVYNTGPDPCNTYTCYDHGAVGALTCGYFSAGESCEIVPGRSDAGAVYPHCCPAEMCNDNIINVD